MTSLSPLQIMLIPSSFIALSGVLALTWQPSHRMRSLIQHFAVGVILAVLSTDVFPEIAKEHAAAEVLIGSFALGGFFMYLMKTHRPLGASSARIRQYRHQHRTDFNHIY